MPVTIKDIAKKAGVSHATVSRALNGHSAIPERTASAIRQLALDMGYFPSAAARELKTRRSRVVGVVVSRFDDPYFGDVLRGAEDVLRQNGYSLFVASVDRMPTSERDILRAFGEHAVDGILFLSLPFNAEYAALLRTYDIPCVVINNQSEQDAPFSVTHNDLEGARQVTRHLLELGHRSIAYLGNTTAGRTNAQRLAGFQQEAYNHSSTLVIPCSGGNPADGALGIRQALASPTRPTAVLCFNDLMAIGALAELQRMGLAVPGDISLAGFDNIPFSALTYPPLTTFDQPRRQIGVESAGTLLNLLSASAAAQPASQVLLGRLQQRASTAPPTKGTPHAQIPPAH